MARQSLNIAFFSDSLTQGVPGSSYFEILKEKLPRHRLFNHGKSGDTVISLYQRLLHLFLHSPLDAGFLWIGVNDVFVKTSPISPFSLYSQKHPPDPMGCVLSKIPGED